MRGLWLCPVTDTDPLQGPDSVLVNGLAVCDLKDQTFLTLEPNSECLTYQPSKCEGAEDI